MHLCFSKYSKSLIMHISKLGKLPQIYFRSLTPMIPLYFLYFDIDSNYVSNYLELQTYNQVQTINKLTLNLT